MAQCAQCPNENPPDASACAQCGAGIAAPSLCARLASVCRSCDAYIAPGLERCGACDAPLAAQPLATPGIGQRVPPAGDQSWLASPSSSPSLTPVPSAAGRPALRRGETDRSAAPAPASLPPSPLPPGWTAEVARDPAAARPDEPLQRCVHCGSHTPASARFCGTCGAGLTVAPGAPRLRARLVLVQGLAGEGRYFPVEASGTPIGRATGAVAFPEDPYLAALHATLLLRDDELVLRDEGSVNGVFVRLREPAVLRPGDLFVAGERLLRFAGAASIPSAATRHGSTRPADRLWTIEEVLEGGGVGRVCRRPGPLVTIGRTGCDVNFPGDGFLSARHAELSLAGETPFLRDLGSANGTFLRVPPRAERTLRHGDCLLMGRELLRVELAAPS